MTTSRVPAHHLTQELSGTSKAHAYLSVDSPGALEMMNAARTPAPATHGHTVTSRSVAQPSGMA